MLDEQILSVIGAFHSMYLNITSENILYQVQTNFEGSIYYNTSK